MKLFVNLFCDDVDAQFAFWRALLDLPEDRVSRSPIYRAVETAAFQFGFHARHAYALLGLAAREPEALDGQPVTGYPTFMLDTPAAVDAAAARVVALGGRVIQGPYPTYYGQWQVVAADPEDHVFRFSTIGLPEGVERPRLDCAAAQD